VFLKRESGEGYRFAESSATLAVAASGNVRTKVLTVAFAASQERMVVAKSQK